jgi:hypothetical protein
MPLNRKEIAETTLQRGEKWQPVSWIRPCVFRNEKSDQTKKLRMLKIICKKSMPGRKAEGIEHDSSTLHVLT